MIILDLEALLVLLLFERVFDIVRGLVSTLDPDFDEAGCTAGTPLHKYSFNFYI